MRTIVILGAILLQSIFVFIACQKHVSAPNDLIENTFTKMFPNAKYIEWDVEDGYFVAEFRENGFEKEAWFNMDNVWVLTKTEYERKTPKLVKDAVNNTNYKGWRIEDTDFIEIRDKAPFYIAEVEKGELEVDLYFSENGNFIKEVLEDGDYHREL
jgi:hypothetical protein